MAEASGDQDWSAVAGHIVLGLAHEMNNRLLALMGIRELAEEGALEPELLRLFDDELSRLGAATRLLRGLGGTAGERELLEGDRLLESVRELHSRNAALRGLRSEWTVPEGLPAVRLDPVTATRALLRTLASSGAAAIRGEAPLRIAAARAEDALVVDISPAPLSSDALRAVADAGGSSEGTPAGVRVRFGRG